MRGPTRGWNLALSVGGAQHRRAGLARRQGPEARIAALAAAQLGSAVQRRHARPRSRATPSVTRGAFLPLPFASPAPPSLPSAHLPEAEPPPPAAPSCRPPPSPLIRPPAPGSRPSSAEPQPQEPPRPQARARRRTSRTVQHRVKCRFHQGMECILKTTLLHQDIILKDLGR